MALGNRVVSQGRAAGGLSFHGSVRLVGSAFLAAAAVIGCGGTDAPSNHGFSGGPSSGEGGDANPSAGSGGTSPNSGGSSGASAGSAGSAGESPTKVPFGSIAATDRGTCALDDAGSILCWGLAPATWPIPAGPFTELVGGGPLICGIRTDDSYACFQEPLGSSSPIDYAPLGAVRAVAVGRGTICALDDAGNASCGQVQSVGIADLTPPSGEQFAQISIGHNFACGLRSSDGSATCWGEAGDDAEDCTGSPMAGQIAAPAGTFTAIASGGFASCAVGRGGSLTCWGAGEPGADPAAVCNGETYNFGQSDPPADAFVSVSVDAIHTCGIRTDGTVACWGAGTADSCTIDTDRHCRQSRPPAGTFVQVVTGLNHSCAITSDRKVQCWGYDAPGEGRITPPAEFQ